MPSDEQRLWENFLRDPREERFLPVFEATKDLFYTICFRILRKPEDAEDAFQAAYGRLLAGARNRGARG